MANSGDRQVNVFEAATVSGSTVAPMVVRGPRARPFGCGRSDQTSTVFFVTEGPDSGVTGGCERVGFALIVGEPRKL